MWQMTLRNIWQRRLRSLLTILGIAVAVQVNLTVNGVISGYEYDLKNQMSALAGRVFVQRPTTDGSGMEEFPSAASSISDDLAQALLNLEGIDPAAPRRGHDGHLPFGGGGPFRPAQARRGRERLEPDRRLDLCFALPKQGLVQLPAQPSYLNGKLAGLVFRDTSEQSRSAIADYVTSQLAAP